MLSLSKSASVLALTLTLAASVVAAQEAESGALSVSRVVLSKGFADGAPVEETNSFARTDGRIYVRIHLDNPSRVAGQIRVHIVNSEGRGGGGVTLDVPARPRYRSLARFGTGRSAGSYNVVIENEAGEQISSTPLTITE